MSKFPFFCGHVGGGVAWFRFRGYGVAAIRGIPFSVRYGYHKPILRVGNWRVEALNQ